MATFFFFFFGGGGVIKTVFLGKKFREKFMYAEVDCQGPGSKSIFNIKFLNQDGWLDRVPSR